MELNQLAFVLEYVDTSIHDTQLLPAYARLIEALAAVAAGDSEAVPAVHEARDAWIGVQRELEPVNWSHEQYALLETYNARALFGELAIGRLLDAFVVNFVDAKGVLNSAETLLADTKDVAQQVSTLLTALDPALTASVGTPEPLEGELISYKPTNGILDNLLDRLNLSPRRDTSIVPAEPSVPLATKVVAAAPIILAAAGKAIELYQTYNALKKNVSVPDTASHPIRTQPAAPATVAAPATAAAPATVNNFVRYTYRQTTIFMQDKG